MILSRTVVVAAGESCSPELGSVSESVRTLELIVVVEEIAALELAEVFESAYALDSLLVFETEPVELCDEHPASVGPVDAETRHSETEIP